eukprot:TRINITY_DN19445_c0_g1_i1.p1 TRINITY_DN19445_c0_g1~~TRINITY_DN19445_c0_g1_i1.p1  ORF type:complete len:101 (-),score=19.68 TRINITY_DN19445_c0_g1_i1:29-331(-)
MRVFPKIFSEEDKPFNKVLNEDEQAIISIVLECIDKRELQSWIKESMKFILKGRKIDEIVKSKQKTTSKIWSSLFGFGQEKKNQEEPKDPKDLVLSLIHI